MIARWHRLKGERVLFIGGSDENGQKIVQAAAAAGQPVKQFVDKNVAAFRGLYKRLNVSLDGYVRTSDKNHLVVAQLLFSQMQKKGDIYKGQYEGLYCYGCEAFYTEKELDAGVCRLHNRKAELLKEESYFFRLSAYEKKIREYFARHPEFVVPASRQHEMVKRLDGLRDLSASRHKVEWGIPVPGDKDHKIYVWVEALESYLTAAGYPRGTWWPGTHLIGTEINWFHSVVWPALLLSAGLELPKHILVHGMILDEKGEKMSKSRGNVVDPIHLLDRYGADPLRYYLLREIPFGEDGRFSETGLKARLNGELASELGNLANRVLTLVEKYKGKLEGKKELEGKFDVEKFSAHMGTLEFHHALDLLFGFVKDCNRYITEKEPWKMEGKELGKVLYNLLEGLRIISIVLEPFLPETSGKLRAQLGIKACGLKDCWFGRWNGRPKKGAVLFQRVV